MINFYKYHGAGNDFILINNLSGVINLTPDYVALVCDRRLGIGADGFILIEKSDRADCFMNYYNSDGTIAEMCGNGIRCTAKFFLEQSNSSLKELNIDTRAGVKKIKVNEDYTYSVNMGIANFSSKDFPSESINLEGFDLNCVSMGNPHAVTIVNDLSGIDIKTIGPKIEKDSHFPNKINVEFVEKIDDLNYEVKVWERGCGETLACGTGACAVFAIVDKLLRQGLKSDARKEMTLKFPGGDLYLSENHEGQIILRGPATFVFKGEII